MLNEFKDVQPLVYNLFINEINDDKVSHAYLIDENGYSDSFSMIIAFIKEIICRYNHLNGLDNLNDSICKRIDDNNYSELKIIDVDGLFIKKQQVIDLQKLFSLSSIEGDKRFYIIKNADMMRSETANSLLKFLEEPDNNITAFLLTNNFFAILPTIVSRCQIVKFNNLNCLNQNLELLPSCIDFINHINVYGYSSILDEKKIFLDLVDVKNKNNVINFLDLLLDVYYDIYKFKCGISELKFNYSNNIIDDISSNFELNDLIGNINCVLQAKDFIKYNVNINLFIDSLLIKLGGSYGNSWY